MSSCTVNLQHCKIFQREIDLDQSVA